jgi:hypothetical protein
LSILPQPRNFAATSTTTKAFIPHVLTKKPTTTGKKTPLPTKISEGNSILKDLDDSDNDDDTIQNDFFSFNKTEDIPIVDIPLDVDKKPVSIASKSTSGQNNEVNLQSYFKQGTVDDYEAQANTPGFSGQYEDNQDVSSGYQNTSAMESSSNQLELDDEAVSI